MVKAIFSKLLIFLTSCGFGLSIYEHEYGKIVSPQSILRLRGVDKKHTLKSSKSKSSKSNKKCKEWLPSESSKGRVTKSSKGSKAESKGGKSFKSSKSSKSKKSFKSDKYCSEAPSITISASPSISSSPSMSPSTSPTNVPSSSPTKFCSTASARDQIIRKIATDVSGDVIEPDSSANNALIWILDRDTEIVDGCDEDLIRQRYALGVLYYSTGGALWKNSSKWLNGDHCDWFGISCVDDIYVFGISLKENNMIGTIPKEVGVLSELKSFTVYDNLLQGTIPLEIFNLQLQLLDLEKNLLNGTPLPNELFNAAFTLESLKLSDNFFDPYTIPNYINQMENLSQLWLANSSLTGTIPPSINNVTSLRSFIAPSNYLNGTIPDLSSMINLKKLQLDFNKLTSTIPLLPPSLEVLRLSNNSLSGEVPSFLGDFIYLENVTLGNNNFYGTIPPGFSNLELLKDVDFRNNKFTGVMPNFGRSTNISSIDLSYNLFIGTIPSDIFELSKLEILYLNHNTFTGSIPENFSNAESLRDLYLYSNMLTGTIPDVHKDSFPRITELLFNDNLLSGSMPTVFCELLSNNNLIKLHADCTVECDCCTQCFSTSSCVCID